MSHLPCTVYSPESPLRDFLRLLRAMFRDIGASRELTWRLFVRDTRAQYRQGLLGYIWAFIPPIAASVPFAFLNAQGVVSISGVYVPYPAYALVGTVLWQVFADSMASPVKTVIAAKAVLTRINLPREAILLAGMGQVALSFLIRLFLLGAAFMWYGITPPPAGVLFPLGACGLMLVGFAIGLLLVPLGLLYSDVQEAIPIVGTFLMLLTPVVYPLPASGIVSKLARWNPLTPLVVVTRESITTGDLSLLQPCLTVMTGALAITFLGWIIYRVALPHVLARVGN
jgi:lipopolysaccharide transport system permease protein